MTFDSWFRIRPSMNGSLVFAQDVYSSYQFYFATHQTPQKCNKRSVPWKPCSWENSRNSLFRNSVRECKRQMRLTCTQRTGVCDALYRFSEHRIDMATHQTTEILWRGKTGPLENFEHEFLLPQLSLERQPLPLIGQVGCSVFVGHFCVANRCQPPDPRRFCHAQRMCRRQNAFFLDWLASAFLSPLSLSLSSLPVQNLTLGSRHDCTSPVAKLAAMR